MSDATQHTPADVRERVAFEAFAWEHGRRGAAAEWIRAQWQGETPKWRAMYFDLADRVLALLRTPRGEGEAWCAFLDALDEFERAANLWVDPEGPTAADLERLRRSRHRVIECARVLAALRSEAQGCEADALDLIRWAEARAVALEPVAGNIMPPGTYACYVGDDDDPYMGPGILGAIRAARPIDRSESVGE